MVAKIFTFADSENFYRKFLRAGGLSVPNAVSVLKSYLKFLCETIKTFDDIIPMTKVNKHKTGSAIRH